jgi:hypothetical protein
MNMHSKSQFVVLLLLATVAAGCRSAGYRVPAGGVAIEEPCGLQVTATKVSTNKRGFSVTFDFANQSDAGLLVPIADIEAEWGNQVARVTQADPRRLRKQFNTLCVSMRLPGSIDSGLFDGTQWVTGASGEPPHGEALYIQARSRVQGFVCECAVPPQPGSSLLVRWRHVYSGDAQGTIKDTVATGVTWTMMPSETNKS